MEQRNLKKKNYSKDFQTDISFLQCLRLGLSGSSGRSLSIGFGFIEVPGTEFEFGPFLLLRL